MRRSRIKPRHMSHEFEIDLAPLLAVMVKLVPVLLVSSGFVQLMTIDSDLPGSLQKAIAESQQQQVAIRISTDSKNSVHVLVSTPQGQKTSSVPAINGQIDLDGTHNALVEVKKTYPQVFHVSLAADARTNYQDLVRVMDQARKVKEVGVEFPYTDPDTKETKLTPWMFPEVMIEPVEDTRTAAAASVVDSTEKLAARGGK